MNKVSGQGLWWITGSMSHPESLLSSGQIFSHKHLIYQSQVFPFSKRNGLSVYSQSRKPHKSNFFVVVQSLSHVQLFGTPWTRACQASLSFINSQSLLKLMSIESVMPSNHLIFCCPLLLPPSIFPSIRVFSNESALRIRWTKYWCFSISPSVNIQDWFPN